MIGTGQGISADEYLNPDIPSLIHCKLSNLQQEQQLKRPAFFWTEIKIIHFTKKRISLSSHYCTKPHIFVQFLCSLIIKGYICT